jgi:P2 family phage contractile tail tube protein
VANTLKGANIGAITNARVYLNTGDLIGMAEKVEGLGMPKPKTTEYKALGMISSVKLFSQFEQPQMKITWRSVYRDVAPCLYNPLVVQKFQIRASQEIYNASGVCGSYPVVAHIHGIVTENSDATVSPGEPTTFTSTIDVTYSKLVIGGEELYLFDPINNNFEVGGIKVFADIFSNWGA